METTHVGDAITSLAKANANLEPDLLSVSDARELLGAYARAQRLAAFGVAALARKLDDASEVARVTGTSLGKARETRRLHALTAARRLRPRTRTSATSGGHCARRSR